MNDEISSVLKFPDLVEMSPSVGVTWLLGSPVNQSLNALVLRHSNFTGSLRVGVIVIVVVGSPVLPTVKVLVADGLTIEFEFSIDYTANITLTHFI